MYNDNRKLYTEEEVIQIITEANEKVIDKIAEMGKQKDEALERKMKRNNIPMIVTTVCNTLIVIGILIFVGICVYGYFNVPSISKYNIEENNGNVNYNNEKGER